MSRLKQVPQAQQLIRMLLASAFAAMLLLACVRSDSARFRVDASGNAAIVGIQIELCNRTVPMKLDHGLFLASTSIDCEGTSVLRVFMRDGTNVACGGTYVTPGLERFGETTLRLTVTEIDCQVEFLKRVPATS